MIKCHHFSHSSAYRRILASRLTKRVPQSREKIASGKITLTIAAELENAVSKEEKRVGLCTQERVAFVLRKLEGKTEDAARAILGRFFPFSLGPKDSLRSINEEESRLNIVLTTATRKLLERAREVLSSQLPKARWSAVLAYILHDFLERHDPLRKMTRPVAGTETHRSVTPALRSFILRRAGGQCEFVDKKSQRRCGSTYFIEVDHIHPRALGGTNAPENLRALCRAHNLYEAERILGPR